MLLLSHLKCYGYIVLSNNKLKTKIVTQMHRNTTRLEDGLFLFCCMKRRGFKVNGSVET